MKPADRRVVDRPRHASSRSRSHQPLRTVMGNSIPPCSGTLTHGRAGDQWRGDGQDSHAGVPTGIKREEVRGPWGFDPSTRSRRHAEASAKIDFHIGFGVRPPDIEP
jgi:hypothetical protein